MEGEGRQCSSRNWFDILGLYSTKRRAEGGLSGPMMKTFSFPSSVLKGSFSIPLTFTADLSPLPSLVVYAIFPNGGVTADSIHLDVALCFQNQVRLTFVAGGELISRSQEA